MSADSVVSAARGWIGTPYVHQASVRLAGADCLGLVRGVWRECIGPEPEAAPAYSSDWSEASREERLWQAAARHMIPKAVGSIGRGDIILFRMRDASVAKHLGIVTEIGERAAFVHAYSGHSVMESPLSMPWQRRIVAAFEFPDRRQ